MIVTDEAPARQALVRVHGQPAGTLAELAAPHGYRFTYFADYLGAAASLTMPVALRTFEWDQFPPFFDGLLPEGPQLEALLRQRKLDARDYLGQLLAVGGDLVGAVTVEPTLEPSDHAPVAK